MKSIKDLAEIRKIEGYKSTEEIQARCNMMSDYMSYQEGPEEDETRKPRPDEPEEYWKETQRIILMAEDIIAKSQTILFYIQDQKPNLYNKQLQQNLILTGATMDNLIHKLRKEEVK